ncbi:MAG: imidazoleglycerol-phosphate dehydratase HisB [Ignavibacteriaceae bacterium]|nr:imidazoleglycerol-phosphate dehydratase HisB [Ignavibacteriaceae bacterium]
MKTIIIDSGIFDLNSSRSEGLISGLKTLQSNGCKLYVDTSLAKLDPLLLKVLKLEKVSLNRIGRNLTYDYSVSSKGKKQLLLNNKSKFTSFEAAACFIISQLRFSHIIRKTKETDISVKVSLDSKKESTINTGIGFFDHMLSQIARHGNIFLDINVKGDLQVDEHHTVEDTGIVLGRAISEAMGNKAGIKRYGFFLPMDESAAYCAIDLGGRTFLNFKADFKRNTVGEFPTELTKEFFRALASGMKANIYLRSAGENDHHKIEAIFKAFAKALNEACRLDQRASGSLPSTKGIL